jgi:hypothetical protein
MGGGSSVEPSGDGVVGMVFGLHFGVLGGYLGGAMAFQCSECLLCVCR